MTHLVPVVLSAPAWLPGMAFLSVTLRYVRSVPLVFLVLLVPLVYTAHMMFAMHLV